MTLTIHILDMLHIEQNYSFLLRDEASGKTAVIDPPEADGVLKALEREGWALDYILNTHHHWDHVNGNLKLKEATGAKVVGNAADAYRIPAIDIHLREGESFALGESVADIMAISGHTIGHIAYYFVNDKAVFCGDTLFAMGCGRLFEGTPQMIVESIGKLMALPDDTRIYCGHEYTLANAKFALSVEPDNLDIQHRITEVEALREQGIPTVPTTVADEKRTNPFVRTHSTQIRESLAMQDASDVEVFAQLRAWKNEFRGK